MQQGQCIVKVLFVVWKLTVARIGNGGNVAAIFQALMLLDWLGINLSHRTSKYERPAVVWQIDSNWLVVWNIFDLSMY